MPDSTVQQDKQIAAALSESSLFADYQSAFEKATDLPLVLKAKQVADAALSNRPNSSSFCLLMANTSKTCRACLDMQSRMEKEADMAPKTLKCFAGLCDTSVPVRVSGRTLAFLQTGQIFLNKPDKRVFSDTAERLLSWGASLDLKTCEEAYFQVKVLNEDQYESYIKLLNTFAEHLGLLAGSMLLEKEGIEPETVSKARAYIKENYDEALPLEKVAEVVNASSSHFCRLFKKSTGLTFTDYVSRVRIEKAKNLLMNPAKRISEAAYEVGFESLSQFNRTFKKIEGVTPSEYRKALKN